MTTEANLAPPGTEAPADVLLDVKDLEVAYGAARALFGVSLTVRTGSIRWGSGE